MRHKASLTQKIAHSKLSVIWCVLSFQKITYNVGLKTVLQQGISEPVFHGNLVYEFKRIVLKPSFS